MLTLFLFALSETQDDLEAITNEIKKLANNVRNKLKSGFLFTKRNIKSHGMELNNA